MLKQTTSYLVLFILFINVVTAQEILPTVDKITFTQGEGFRLSSEETTIYVVRKKSEVMELAQYLGALLQVKIVEEKREGSINLVCGDGDLSDESYSINCDEKSIELKANSYRGLVWSVQTLLQLAPAEVLNKQNFHARSFTIPAMQIFDRPKYGYRGMHLDVCRNFFTVAEVKKFIDYMSMHKLNILHWHLSDDQGWRIEIKKYPKLTKIGAKRNETPKLGNRNRGDGVSYGPYFYTHDEIREVVAYAKIFGIEIIPEIDLPGHAQAALAAYGEFGCSGGPYGTWTKWGVSPEVFCAGNDSTIEFLKDVFDEVVELFPSRYVHVGGDECPKQRWQKCEKCIRRLKEVGVKSFHELQTWVIMQMQKHLELRGKKIIGWDEILCPTLSKDATIMSWQGVIPGIRAAQENYKVIMTPNNFLYFDYGQGNGEFEPESIGGYVGLETVYGFDVNCGLAEEFGKNILGAQANCWSEYFHSFSRLEYAILPRMAALAEITWHAPSLEKRDINVFQRRLLHNFLRYDALKANFRFVGAKLPERILFTDKYILEFPKVVEKVELKY
ncbi:MAG: beta-N-acetylhexosaminidase, partial [Lentisphaeria bacterium]